MSSTDRRVGPSAPSVRRTNPRAARTRANVIAAARILIAEVGLSGFNYTSVAKRSGVTRQTLYRHWPHREQLLRDIMLEGPDNYAAVASATARSILLAFAGEYARKMALREYAAPILELMSHAAESRTAEQELAVLVDRRLRALNERLLPTGVYLDSEDFSILLGPITSRRFINRGPVTDSFLERAVDHLLRAPPAAAAAGVSDAGRLAAKV